MADVSVSESETVAAVDVRLNSVSLGKRVVLTDVALSCQKGTHTAILGRNGAGKTTLLRAIVGLVKASGSVRINGAPLHELSPLQRARLVAYVPQRSELQARLSVEDVVAQGRFAHRQNPVFLRGGQAHGSHRASELRALHARAIEVALDMTDTRALRYRYYPELSGGEQRRVLLARALASEAPVIALDEPTAGLDISHALAFYEQLRHLTAWGRTVVTVLHHLNDAASWCDRAAVVHDGKLFFEGPPTLPAEVVREVYDVEVVPGAAPDYRLVGNAVKESHNA